MDSQKNIHEIDTNKILMLFAFVFIFNKFKNDDGIKNFDFKLNLGLDSLDIKKTNEKMKVLRKVGPYFPKDMGQILNKALLTTEKIVRLYSVMDFIKTNNSFQTISSIDVSDKERANYILSTIKTDIPNEEIKSIVPLIDIVINLDTYKNLLSSLFSVLGNTQSSNGPKDISKIIEPLMDGKSDKDKEKMKDMMKMVELFKALNTSNKKEQDPSS